MRGAVGRRGTDGIPGLRARLHAVVLGACDCSGPQVQHALLRRIVPWRGGFRGNEDGKVDLVKMEMAKVGSRVSTVSHRFWAARRPYKALSDSGAGF